MTFDELLTQIIDLLQREGRVSYRALKRRFNLDDEYIEDLKAELIDAKRVAVDEDGKVLEWVGKGINGETDKGINGEKDQDSEPRTLHSEPPSAERRQLTVLFCDLVGSTALSARLDPEDYRAVVQQYQHVCTEVIQRHEGYLAQYLGDGLLVYFGYPKAHEDDARRAVRTGLEIISAIQKNVLFPLVGEGQGEGGVRTLGSTSLQVRIGIHTGLVVVGEIGSREKRELLALGETPNLAARIQGLAEPNTVIVSATTQRLIDGQFECQPFGSHLVKGIDAPIAVYHVQSERQNATLLGNKATLTPLVGREQEVGLLFNRWEQVKEGRGQVVLLSGEPGIGKSRLAHTLKEQVANEGYLLIESRCSPYHQHSALYPLIEFLQRVLLLTRQEPDTEKVEKLERALALYGMQESLPLFTALLSLPTPSQYPLLNLTPQKQKERTLQAAVQWLVAQAERQATVSVWEDLHWADPSSLEFLSLLVEQIPTSKLLLVLTFRPEFTPPWKLRSHLTQLTLNRLGKRYVETMIEKVAEGKTLPVEVVEQIRSKTDGVPLFVEELTKSVIESTTSVGARHASPLQLAIPATLQEALLARLDRLSSARQIAQLGATLGREFSYELLHAVASASETELQAALAQLVEAEILYQRGVGQQAHYFFKHALIQDTAYESLLKSTRQRYHRQIAQVLEEQFSDAKKTQPELLAHHYTEAGLTEQAIPYWQRAGERAVQRSANVEAISYLTKGLELLKTSPDSPDHVQQELTLQITLATSLMATKGFGVPELEQVYARARELCRQIGETPLLFRVLGGLWTFHTARAEHKTACELGEQLLTVAQSAQDQSLLLRAHTMLGPSLFFLGDFSSAREQVEQGIALYGSQQYRSRALVDPGVICLVYISWNLWYLGYPNQALEKSHEALALAGKLSNPFSLAAALQWAAMVQQSCGRAQGTQEQAEALIALCTEQGFGYWLASGTIQRGWALLECGQGEEGIRQMHEGIAAYRATKANNPVTYFLALLAEAHRKVGQIAEGLAVLAEVLDLVNKTDERFYEAELYRLKGELTLQQESKVQSLKLVLSGVEGSKVTDPRPLIPDPQGEAEACFLKAIDIAREQQAKSLELRVVMSLTRLWQQQDKKAEAHTMLSEIYNWFTEGFDTKDLQEAKQLLDELMEDKL
ncbi:MAG: adenylate/guanylate cyclase domain-containing protein [Candidatus Binatia bacterium]